MPLDIIDTWKARFAEVGAEPIMLIGVRPDGSPHIAALDTIHGERLDLRQFLTCHVPCGFTHKCRFGR
jgi:hypothetical protein